jgi:hypothetical protein
MDLVKDQVKRRDLEDFLVPDSSLLDTDPMERARIRAAGSSGVLSRQGEQDEQDERMMGRDPGENEMVMRGASFRKLNRAVAGLIESFSMVRFLTLDLTDEDSVEAVLSHIDDCIQYHEAQEPKEPNDEIEYEEDV